MTNTDGTNPGAAGQQRGVDDVAFAVQAANRAMTAGLSDGATMSLLRALCPDLPQAEFMQALREHADAAAGRSAEAEAGIPQLQCAKVVLERAPGPTLGEAVDQLGIDFDQFAGIATAQAAAAGVAVANLPADVMDECLAAANLGQLSSTTNLRVPQDLADTSPQLGLILGRLDGPCGLCGNEVHSPPIGVVLVEGDPVCQDCSNKHEPGLWELAAALDDIDDALWHADPKHRPTLVSVAINVLTELTKAYEEQETAA